MSTLASKSQSLQLNLADRIVNFFACSRSKADACPHHSGHCKQPLFFRDGWLQRRTNRSAIPEDGLPEANADAASLRINLARSQPGLLRNSPLAVGAIGTVVQSVVGSGLTLQAKPDIQHFRMDAGAGGRMGRKH
jgi:hypothetical protein